MSNAFTHQVGGHVASITLSPTGASTVMKPASETELAFYQNLGPQLNAIVPGGFIGEWTPAYYGTLTLEGRMGDNGEVDEEADTSGEVPKVSEPGSETGVSLRTTVKLISAVLHRSSITN
jgi:hypothetical protein